ncbi:aminotransferase class I/II-fold pyridoxal phosphate-dependent enzyme [Dyella acidisoli]
MHKKNISDLANFGGTALFATPRSTSNLVRPDVETFLLHSKSILEQRRRIGAPSLVEQLERELAEFHNTTFCVAFSNGFWGLALAMKCLAVPGKTEIVMPSLTYRRMADIAAWVKLVPHYCEIDAHTLGINAETAARCINENTALLLAVHPIVNCCEIDGLVGLAERNNLPLLVDAVESVYETYKGKKIGSFGNAECFSMHASKLINGFEGGYLTTNDPDLAEKLIKMRSMGVLEDGRTIPHGIDATMNDVHAAMALASLLDLPAQVERNRMRYEAYKHMLGSVPGINLLAFDEREQCSYKNIVVRLSAEWPLSRADTLSILHSERVIARPYYSPALHMKRTTYPTIAGDLSLTESLAEQFMLLPCGYFVDDDDTALIVSLLRFIHDHADQITRQLHQK